MDEDDLYHPEYIDNILIPNSSPPNRILSSKSYGVTDLSNIDSIMQEQVEWMHKTFEPHIRILKKTFGSDNVNVRFGVISYWS